MMSLILLASPLGVVFGYGGTGWLIGSGLNWRYAFFSLGIVMVASSIVIAMVPDRFLNLDECVELKRDLKEKRNNEYYKTLNN